MHDDESELNATAESAAADAGDEGASAPPLRPPARPPTAVERREPGASPFRIIKPGQGLHVRWGTALGAGALALAFANFVWDRARVFAVIDNSDAVHTLIPVVVLVAAAYLIFWIVGRSPRAVDFMIATEGEMKKVNWSTRREVWGATRVVIVTLFALAMILAIVDAVFIVFFSKIGVLKFNVLESFFGGEGGG